MVDNFPNDSICINTVEGTCPETTPDNVPKPQPTKSVERTLILFKPDAVERKIVGRIIDRFESKGLNMVAMKLILVS